MNLVQDPWLSFRLRDGSAITLPMTAIAREDVVDFALPRADFQGAAYQFAIGLLQTVFAPEKKRQWHERYRQPPASNVLQEAFDTVAHAFQMTGDGPLFMQDVNTLADAKPSGVASLLIEAPGENGIKLNTDHFIKRGIAEVVSLEMAAMALFTLQINAPSGGQGHRTGLRGGGPLTTLVLPQSAKSTLWQKLWLNIIDLNSLRYDPPNLHDGSVFPWLQPTQTSETKGSEVYAEDVHYLQMFWSMPRRIRLQVEKASDVCQISGESCDRSVASYRSKNYGTNYAGNWMHPLTPYRWNPKKPGDELSAKGQPGGITYKIFDALSFSSEKEGQRCATVVEQFSLLVDGITGEVSEQARLWVFGYDMDNMKARGWYSTEMPLFAVDSTCQEDILYAVKELQAVAGLILWFCRTQIKAAWFDSPKEAKGDMSFIDLAFWQRTEALFYAAVQQLISNQVSTDKNLTTEQARHWLNGIRGIAMDIFDQHALAEQGGGSAMVRRIQARKKLQQSLYYKTSKELKVFVKEYDLTKQEA